MRALIYAGFLLACLIPKQSSAFKYNNSHWTNLGSSENIVFFIDEFAENDNDKEIKSCSWTIRTPARNETFELNEINSCFKDKYCYSGEGLNNGECGLLIGSVTKEDIGVWECNMTRMLTRRSYKRSTQLELITVPLVLTEQDLLIVPINPEAAEVNISVKFSGNRNTYFCWVIADNSREYNHEVVLYQPNHTENVSYDYDNEKYNISRRKINSSDVWESVLFIKNFSPHDLAKNYILNVTNEFGIRTLQVKLEFEDKDEDTSNWLLILGAILFTIFTVGTVILILCAFKKKRMLCFRRKISYEVNSQPRISATKYIAASTMDDAPDEVQVPEDNSVGASSGNK